MHFAPNPLDDLMAALHLPILHLKDWCSPKWYEGTMQENDRRFRQRFDMRVQVKIRNLDSPDLSEQQVESSNISGRGVYFSTDLPLEIGARVEMFLTMPVEIAGKDSRLWRCTGRVVRMQPRSPSQAKAGNGVEIHYYEVLDKARAVVANPRSGRVPLP